MADLSFTETDADVLMGQALAAYKAATGVDLQPADPRRLHLQTIVNLLVQCRSLIDFAGKQNLLRYVGDLYIDALAELLGATKNAAGPSTCTIRFVPGLITIPAGKRVAGGSFLWAVKATTLSTDPAHTDVLCECTVSGSASNGLGIGQVNTLVDSIPGIASASNVTITSGGSDIESTEAFRTRLRGVPESRAVAGPRRFYEDLALAASSVVAGAAAVGRQDSASLAGTVPAEGEVYVLIIEGARDAAGTLTSVVPTPSGALITVVNSALTAEDVRPLADKVTVKAPSFVEFDTTVTYYIAESRRDFESQIQTDATAAFNAYLLSQQAIGKDINPTELQGRMWAAGVKRVVVTSPSFAALLRDQCPNSRYETLTYGGIEAD